MLGMKNILLMCCTVTVLGDGGSAAGCNVKSGAVVNQNTSAAGKRDASTAPPPTTRKGESNIVEANMKTLAEGAYSEIEQPFVAVVRDAETYAALRELAGALPEMNGGDFSKHTIVVGRRLMQMWITVGFARSMS